MINIIIVMFYYIHVEIETILSIFCWEHVRVRELRMVNFCFCARAYAAHTHGNRLNWLNVVHSIWCCGEVKEKMQKNMKQGEKMTSGYISSIFFKQHGKTIIGKFFFDCLYSSIEYWFLPSSCGHNSPVVVDILSSRFFSFLLSLRLLW